MTTDERPAEPWPPSGEHTERHAERDGNADRCRHERQMLRQRAPKFSLMIEPKLDEPHREG